MMAPTKIRCRVIAIPVTGEIGPDGSLPRPSELVPWADPYIAGLINRLQTEIRNERAEQGIFADGLSELELTAYDLGPFEFAGNRFAGCFNEAEWPWNEDQFEFEQFDPADDERITDRDDRLDDLPAIR